MAVNSPRRIHPRIFSALTHNSFASLGTVQPRTGKVSRVTRGGLRHGLPLATQYSPDGALAPPSRLARLEVRLRGTALAHIPREPFHGHSDHGRRAVEVNNAVVIVRPVVLVHTVLLLVVNRTRTHRSVRVLVPHRFFYPGNWKTVTYVSEFFGKCAADRTQKCISLLAKRLWFLVLKNVEILFEFTERVY